MHTRTGVAVAVAVASLSGVASAEQVVVFDSRWTHTADTPDSHYRLPPVTGTPANWVAPVDYSNGSAYVHLEVLTKPTDTPTKFQVCFEGTPTYGCTDQSRAYTTTGVIDWGTPFNKFYVPPGETVDWTKGANSIAIILKDTMNGKPSAANVGAATAALYTPTDVHVVVTLVAAGSTYVPPGSADAGGPGAGVDSGDGAGGATSMGGGGASGSGGALGAGAANGSGGRASGGTGAIVATGGTTAGTGKPPVGVPDASSSAGASGSSSGSSDDGGCSLSSGVRPRSPFAPWLVVTGLVALALALARRRRRTGTMKIGFIYSVFRGN